MSNPQSNCLACQAAEKNPLSSSYWSRCMECNARLLAHSPVAFTAVNNGQVEKLQELIRRVWGDEYEAGKQAVWRWMQRIKAARAAQKG